MAHGWMALTIATGLWWLLAASCGGSTATSSDTGGAGASDASPGGVGGGASGGVGAAGGGGLGASGGFPPGLCLLGNCNFDAECAGCSFDMTTCKASEHKCIACDSTTGPACASGFECTPSGTCVPVPLTCPTDAQGNPSVVCATNADCAACGPMHQICGESACVACMPGNTSLCGTMEKCVDGKCVDKCPSPCANDTDCSSCEITGPAEGMKAKACFEQACAKCSATLACPTGLSCQKGDCVKGCGISGSTGACNTATDCAGCGSGQTPGPWACAQGACKLNAAGCSDLGGIGVLPAPWNQPLDLCANDGDCAGVSAQYNVGALIRSVIGDSQLDIGIKKLAIQDVYVPYGMGACSAVELSSGMKCGVCTPCHVDADCKKIALGVLVFDLFKGDPLAQVAGGFLLDMLFAKDPDPSLHFQCLEVAPSLGVCSPCPDPMHAC